MGMVDSNIWGKEYFHINLEEAEVALQSNWQGKTGKSCLINPKEIGYFILWGGLATNTQEAGSSKSETDHIIL
jgi:hypothetical protein